MSRGAELNVAPLTTVLLWFRQKMSVLDSSTSPAWLINQTAKRLKEDATFRERVLLLIRHADLGISDLEVSEEQYWYSPLMVPTSTVGGDVAFSSATATALPVISGSMFLNSTAHVIPGTLLTGLSSGTYLPTVPAIRSVHRTPDGEAVRFDFLEAESSGTQRFFALAGLWLEALDQGALLVIDELDCSMHPELTQKLVELFQTRDANPKGAQLVFSTHDSTLMDLELFRRDQIWIVEKDRAGASRLSSIYDFEEKPRSNEALQRRYLAGRYGGVPVFGPTFEDLELK